MVPTDVTRLRHLTSSLVTVVSLPLTRSNSCTLASQLAFWTEMESAIPNQGQLEKIAGDFKRAVATATASFETLLTLNPKSVSSLRDYAVFLQKVRP